ncbi:MAG: type I-E CRISPR-associated protein Cse1/CasA [Verrucomicrobiaceae bacterium]|nr:type I-E CRISPR-associated protein Cse1/CasA [Verrucomicrobiaceae bacterium]
MNLTTDPWVPVLDRQGTRQLLSLQDLFAQAHELRDLAVKPHEKIALLRLLICITQASLNGPDDHSDWKSCRDDIQPKVKDYLEKWKSSFELFGDGPRFLQVPGLKAAKEDDEGNAATKLDLTLASGNNASLFDNAAGILRPVKPERLALTLLTFQCFSPGGRIGVAKWNGADTAGKGSSNHAPCTPSSMLHTYLIGESLLETIHLNLLDKEEAKHLGAGGWGKPVWELPVTSLAEKAAIANATTSYLGRLVPLSRAIRLEPEGRSLILANGIDYPLLPIYREPAATVILRDEEPAVIGISLGRSIWRQLASISMKRIAQNNPQSGPRALMNVPEDRRSTLWIGALATDKAKIEDVVEAAYELAPILFEDEGRKCYESGVAHADAWSEALSKSVKACAATLKLEPVPYERARHFYWTAVEQHVPLLLKAAESPATVGDWKETEWGRKLREAAEDAYEHACPAQTPRQIEAFAIGRGFLFLPKPDTGDGKKAKGSANPKKGSKSAAAAS